MRRVFAQRLKRTEHSDGQLGEVIKSPTSGKPMQASDVIREDTHSQRGIKAFRVDQREISGQVISSLMYLMLGRPNSFALVPSGSP